MYPRGARHAGQIRAIVDDDERAVRRAGFHNRVAQLEKGARPELLGADLKQARAAVEIRACEVYRRPAGTPRDVDVDNGLKG